MANVCSSAKQSALQQLQPHVDVSPCADQQVVLYYVSKYYTKAETETVKLDDIES